MQQDNLDIVSALQNILKSVKHLKKLAQTSPDEWPMVKLVLNKIVNGEDGNNTYHGAHLQSYSESTLKSCQNQAVTDFLHLDQRLRHNYHYLHYNYPTLYINKHEHRL